MAKKDKSEEQRVKEAFELQSQVNDQAQENSLLKGLNPQQKEAVKDTKGEVVVMAGAGSGKTRVLTRRIAYLISHDKVSPQNILAVTFTNKASNEMSNRIAQLLHQTHSGVTACTFHAFGFMLLHQVLKYEPQVLKPYTSSFNIILPSTQKTMVKHIISDDLNKDTKEFQPKDIIGQISKFKNDMLLPNQVKGHINQHSPYQKVACQAYAKYEDKLVGSNQMDFDDLLLMPVLLFINYPKILQIYQDKYQYISVDEFQDVNKLQMKSLQLLSSKYHNLFVVGDVNQSIYSWRGSKPQYILDFKKDHPNAKQIFMTQNYRSTKNILKVANAVIRNNKHRTKVDAYTDNPSGVKVGLYKGASTNEEVKAIGMMIKKLHNQEHVPYNDIAILYRTNFQSRLFEETFFHMHIPKKVLNSTDFFQRKEIMDMLAYLQLMVNKKDDASLERIINQPKRHIGKASLKKLGKFAYAHKYHLLDACLHVYDSTKLGKAPKKHIFAFGKLMADLRSKFHNLSVSDAIKLAIDETDYERDLRDKIDRGKQVPQNKNRISNLNELINAGADYDEQKKNTIPRSTRMQSFLSYVALMSDQDSDNDNKPKVLLMTLHAAKGMEFPVVFLVGMAQDTLPLSFDGVVENLEEERRLCYVGMTRAEKRLYLSYGEMGRSRGQVTPEEPSVFLSEIPTKDLRPIHIDVPVHHYYKHHNSNYLF